MRQNNSDSIIEFFFFISLFSLEIAFFFYICYQLKVCFLGLKIPFLYRKRVSFTFFLMSTFFVYLYELLGFCLLMV